MRIGPIYIILSLCLMGCTTMRSLRSGAGSYTLDKCIAVLLFMPKDKVRIRLITRII